MDTMQNVGKSLLRLIWAFTKIAVTIVLGTIDESSSGVRRYTYAQAHTLFHEGKISSAEYVEATED